MTIIELHNILDDDNNLITVNELRQIIYELKQDVLEEYYKENDKKMPIIIRWRFMMAKIMLFKLFLICSNILFEKVSKEKQVCLSFFPSPPRGANYVTISTNAI